MSSWLEFGTLGGYSLGAALVTVLYLTLSEPAMFAVRYGGVSIGFNISVAVFGGTTPFIAEALIAGTGVTWIPAVMLMVAGVGGLVAVRGTREPDSRPLPGSAPTAADRHEAGTCRRGAAAGNRGSTGNTE